MFIIIFFIQLHLCGELTREDKVRLAIIERQKKFNRNNLQFMLIPTTKKPTAESPQVHTHKRMIIDPYGMYYTYPRIPDPERPGVFLDSSESLTDTTEFTDSDSEKERNKAIDRRVYYSEEDTFSEGEENLRNLGCSNEWKEYNKVSEPRRETMFKKNYSFARNLHGSGTGEFRVYKNNEKNKEVLMKLLIPRDRRLLYRAKYFLKSEKRAHGILRKDEHKHLMNCYTFFCPKTTACFVVEYIKGVSLLEFLQMNYGNVDPQHLKYITAQIFLGIECLHKNKIIHRDIKTKNIMISRGLNVRIIDYGFAIEHLGKINNIFCGSPFYNSPEVLCHRPYGLEVDWWGFGVILFYIHTYSNPYPFHDRDSLYGFMKSGDCSIKKTGDKDLDDLIEKLLTIDKRKRLCGIKEEPHKIRSHPYFKDILNDQSVCCKTSNKNMLLYAKKKKKEIYKDPGW